jgi:hypothetical protein
MIGFTLLQVAKMCSEFSAVMRIIQDQVLFDPLDPGLGKEIRIRDEHPESYFRELSNNFLG